MRQRRSGGGTRSIDDIPSVAASIPVIVREPAIVSAAVVWVIAMAVEAMVYVPRVVPAVIDIAVVWSIAWSPPAVISEIRVIERIIKSIVRAIPIRVIPMIESMIICVRRIPAAIPVRIVTPIITVAIRIIERAIKRIIPTYNPVVWIRLERERFHSLWSRDYIKAFGLGDE